jgi:hypothetical protein
MEDLRPDPFVELCIGQMISIVIPKGDETASTLCLLALLG